MMDRIEEKTPTPIDVEPLVRRGTEFIADVTDVREAFNRGQDLGWKCRVEAELKRLRDRIAKLEKQS